MKDGSVELFFDDLGIVQQIVYRPKRRRRAGEKLEIHSVKNGKVIANYDNDGTLQYIVKETTWKRNLHKKT